MSNKPVLEIKDVCFKYNDIPILKDVNLTVNEKDYIMITGLNGSGKSTLIKVILNELTLNSGTIKIFGENLASFLDWQSIGYISQTNQHTNFNFPISVEEVVGVNIKYSSFKEKFSQKIIKEKVMKALNLVGMDGFEKRVFSELSSGQQQRVFLARALVNDVKMILLDEPTTGVDQASIKKFLQLLKELNKKAGLTIIMITHETGEVINDVSQIFYLENSKLIKINKDELAYYYLDMHSFKEKGV